MQTGNTVLEEVLVVLRHARTYVQVALEREGGGMVAKRLLVDVRPDSRQLPTRCWVYDFVVLLSGPCPGRQVADWINGDAHLMGHAFRLPALSDHVSWQEHSSNSRNAFSPLPWPFRQYVLSPSEGALQTSLRHQDFLVGRDVPSFPSAHVGAMEFMYGGCHRRASPGTDLTLRFANSDAWIKHVHLTPTSMTVRLRGRKLLGCRLELLAPAEGHQSLRVERHGPVKFVLPRGLPEEPVLLLSRDGEWRDDRPLGEGYRLGRPDISWEGGNRTTEIETLVSAGESQTLEYKQQLPPGGVEGRKMLKTVPAFANGEGGFIIFGVADETREVMGVADARRGCDALTDQVRNMTVPVPDFTTEVVSIRNKDLVVLTVRAGNEVPYGIRRPNHPHPDYYIRRAGTTFLAEPHEVRAIVLTRQPRQSHPWAAT